MSIVVSDPKNPSEISFAERAKELDELEQEKIENIRKARKSPFSNFYQVNKDNSIYLRNCLSENPKALELLFFIFDHMDRYNAVMCSYKVFQEALGISPKTIQRSIKYLKDNGFISILKSGTSNVYVVNPDLVWNSWGNNVQYCEFPANVIISATEQEERAKTVDKRFKSIEIKD